MRTRRNQAINNTKIKYISVLDKIYEVTGIQWLHSYLEAKETDLNIGDVPESELWEISYFEGFHIRLVNNKGETKVIDMAEWLERNKKE